MKSNSFRFKVALLLTCIFLVCSQLHAQIITTIAGSDSVAGSTLGDGGQATVALLRDPFHMVMDRGGNIFFSEHGSHTIRKITASGIITTIAGTGYNGFSGDGGPATAAKLFWPSGLALDTGNNLYVVDQGNNRIRKITPSGIISTIAGIGGGYSGDGGPATAARMGSPVSIVIDRHGNLFISEISNNIIRKISSSGYISTFAGVAASGAYSGDGGPATAAHFFYPQGLALDTAGNLYLCDELNSRIRKIDGAGIIHSIAGDGIAGYRGDGGPATAARFEEPTEIGLDTLGNIYFMDSHNNRVRKINLSGTILTVAGTDSIGFAGDGGPATAARLRYPWGILIDTSNTIYITDRGNYRIRKMTTCPVPVVGSVTGAGIVCSGASITLSDTTAGGAWTSSDTTIARVNASTGIVTALRRGSLVITYAKGNSCGIQTSTRSITVDTILSAGLITGTAMVCAHATTTLSDTITGGSWSSGATGIATISSTGVVTGVSAGIAIISYAVTNSCGTRVATDTITVMPLPYPGSITGVDSICMGSTAVLSDTSAGGVWSSGAASIATVNSTGIVTGILAGTAIISYTVSNSCGIADTTFSITVKPAPNVGTIYGADSICISDTTTYSNAITGGTWSSSNVTIATISTVGLVTGIATGTATISYSVTNPCGTATATHTLVVRSLTDCPTEVNQVVGATANDVSTFPNPNEGIFTVEIPIHENDATISIIDLHGRTIKTLIVTNKSQLKIPVNLTNIAAGVYMLKAQVDGTVYYRKVVVF